MNALLVDDDRFVVAALEKKISSENHRKKLHRYLCLRYRNARRFWS